MDAQNAAESSSTKQPASPKGAESDLVKSKPAVNIPKQSSSVAKDPKPSAAEEDAAPDQNSDAETIVLPGKDGISPSKPRKVIKHEDKSDEEMTDIPQPRKQLKDRRDSGRNDGRNDGHSDDSAALPTKKKRPSEKEQHLRRHRPEGSSSAPTSPPAHRRNSRDASHRRNLSGDGHSASESEATRSRTHKSFHKDRLSMTEKHLAKRKALKTESDDEAELRKARRPRLSEANTDVSIGSRERDHHISTGKQPEKQSVSTRSASPPLRAHRRSLSTQLPSHSSNGLSNKKRRVPAPLQPSEYQSDDSSASGSPHPRSSKLRSVITPITGDSTISPARLPGHKKHVDNHGQTLFAKACAKGEYDVAKKRLSERPDDLNFADYAGNTPLQVASLNGHEDIVELLIEAGCKLDCRNSDKETPLLDAVENGHLGVVKLLLKAGVNPRKADAEGHEPLEKVPDDLDNAEEIRAALREAKERVGELRRTSEDHQVSDMQDALSSHGPDSPRRSPPAFSSLLAEKRRGGTVRSTKTSNHLLYMNLDDKTLRQAAARGDNETVTRVLQVKDRCDDPEALVNAARGGHNLVVELLLALGGANPDPRPVSGLPVEYGTPMLAAIGQENIEVIRLLLNASDFDPTRRYKGQTYYEIARRREGPNWKEEEHILKEAYDRFKKGSRNSKVKSSPSRRGRDGDSDTRRAHRIESSPDMLRSQKRRSASPPRDAEVKKKSHTVKATRSPREKRRSLSFGTNEEQTSPKRGPGRPKKDDRNSNNMSSDRETSPVRTKIPTKPKVIEPDPAGSSDGEAAKPRRKLVSGQDLKRREKRRESTASNRSNLERTDTKNEDVSEKSRADRLSEKHTDRAKVLKREESNDRHSANDTSSKRQRLSVSPSRRGHGEKEDSGAPLKRRKLNADSKERRHLGLRSPDDRHTNRDRSRDSTKRQNLPEISRKETGKSHKGSRDRRESEKSIIVASEEADMEMHDASQDLSEDGEIQSESELDGPKEARKIIRDSVGEEVKKDTDREVQERQRKSQEEEMKRKAEEAEQRRSEAEERARLAREEAKRKDAAEKARLEEEQRREEAEEERRRQEEQQRKQKEERERKQREEEEERLRREREAAEEARRVREEEEHRERERKRAERAAREAEQQRARQAEQERIRLAKLPPLLRWLDGCQDPKKKEIAELFAKAQGVRYDTIDPSATGKPGGRDQWLLNTQVALLLGEKDLSLSRYTAWEKVPATNIAKRVIWRLEQDRYALTEGKLYHLGEQLPDLYGGDPHSVGYKKLEQIRGEAAAHFFETDMFFVKESDFLYIVPTVTHLCNVRLSICYRELPEDESALATFSGPAKWKTDAEATTRGPFAPRNKYYVNGQLIGEEKPGKYVPSKAPFPEHRVPRRHGLVAVAPDEPDYARLCIEQNLAHLLTEQQKQSVLAGAHLTPRSMVSTDPTDYSGENLSPSSISPRTQLVNGISHERLPNGTNGTLDEAH